MTGNVYFIQCHESAERLKLLFRTIYNPRAHYIIHCDKKSPYEVRWVSERLQQIYPNVTVLSQQWVSWGGYSQVQILIDGLKAAMQLEASWQHFILLSEHHVAVRAECEFEGMLTSGTSYFQSARYQNMGAGGQSDIDHRFSAECKELAAWGMFPLRGDDRTEWVRRTVCHGSNWVVLCRDHCSLILDAVSVDGETIRNLRTSIQPDEMFVQTVLAEHLTDSNAHVNRDMTYVAWPHLSGTSDLTFVAKNYFDAEDKGFMFIRKSPDELPHEVLTSINSFATLDAAELSEELGDPLSAPTTVSDAKNLSASIMAATSQLGMIVEDIKPGEPRFCPSIYLQFKHKNLPKGLFVAVISENLRDAKLLICWEHKTDNFFEPLEVSGIETHVLKARVAGLAFNREVLVSTDDAKGFFDLSKISSFDLAQYVNSYMEYALAFADKISKDMK